LKVVNSAPAATITGPIPLPSANSMVLVSGEDDCDSLLDPSTAIAVPATKKVSKCSATKS
jgi:hypothetical protein